ncbi:MAG: hypothetical protein WKF47_13805 [Geodermatophilaceae bacterium]
MHPGGAGLLPDGELLALAAVLEGHPDNVAACLLGGLTIAWTEDGAPRAVRLEPHRDVSVTLLRAPGSALDASCARPAAGPRAAHRRGAKRRPGGSARARADRRSFAAAVVDPAIGCISPTGRRRCPRPRRWSPGSALGASRPWSPAPGRL